MFLRKIFQSEQPSESDIFTCSDQLTQVSFAFKLKSMGVALDEEALSLLEELWDSAYEQGYYQGSFDAQLT